jgi:hypothetical protein
LETAAFGAQGNTVGGLNKGSFLTDLQNQYATIAGAGTNPVNDALTDIYIQAQTRTPDGSAPNLILTSAALYKAYKDELYTQQRFIDEAVLDGGKLALAFNGARMFVDPFMGSALTSDGTNDINAYVLNTNFMKMVFDTDGNFEMTDFVDATGYASRYAYITVRTQLAFDHLASQGIVDGLNN